MFCHPRRCGVQVMGPVRSEVWALRDRLIGGSVWDRSRLIHAYILVPALLPSCGAIAAPPVPGLLHVYPSLLHRM